VRVRSEQVEGVCSHTRIFDRIVATHVPRWRRLGQGIPGVIVAAVTARALVGISGAVTVAAFETAGRGKAQDENQARAEEGGEPTKLPLSATHRQAP
jgi:hypothetical protein